jgi:hypothetical protein
MHIIVVSSSFLTVLPSHLVYKSLAFSNISTFFALGSLSGLSNLFQLDSIVHRSLRNSRRASSCRGRTIFRQRFPKFRSLLSILHNNDTTPFRESHGIINSGLGHLNSRHLSWRTLSLQQEIHFNSIQIYFNFSECIRL